CWLIPSPKSCCKSAASSPGSARVSRVGDRVLAIADFSVKIVSARRRKSEPDWHLHTRRVRYPESYARRLLRRDEILLVLDVQKHVPPKESHPAITALPSREIVNRRK